MLMLAITVFSAVASGAMQEPVAVAPASAAQQTQQGPPPVVSQDAVPAASAQAPPPEGKQVVTIPSGTRIPLTLANAINPKAARRGDTVRAYTAFPVTVDSQVAMPAGVLVEGVIDKLVKKDRYGHPWIQAHFTRMVFPSGYVLRLEAQSEEARAENPDEHSQPAAAHPSGPSDEDAFAFQFPQATNPPPPSLPPLPKPNYGPAIAIGVGGAAAAIAVAVIAYHHRYDYFWYGVGWQFDMVLQSPLAVDAANWNVDTPN